MCLLASMFDCVCVRFGFSKGFGKDNRSTGIMSRPMILVCLLLILIITSQFEWRQQLVSDMDTNPAESQKQHQISKREEGVKEKVFVASSNLYLFVICVLCIFFRFLRLYMFMVCLCSWWWTLVPVMCCLGKVDIINY